jgi:hypothetical protein
MARAAGAPMPSKKQKHNSQLTSASCFHAPMASRRCASRPSPPGADPGGAKGRDRRQAGAAPRKWRDACSAGGGGRADDDAGPPLPPPPYMPRAAWCAGGRRTSRSIGGEVKGSAFSEKQKPRSDGVRVATSEKHTTRLGAPVGAEFARVYPVLSPSTNTMSAITEVLTRLSVPPPGAQPGSGPATIVGSAALCAVVFALLQATGLALPRSPKRPLSKGDALEWNLRVVSTLHAIVLTVGEFVGVGRGRRRKMERQRRGGRASERARSFSLTPLSPSHSIHPNPLEQVPSSVLLNPSPTPKNRRSSAMPGRPTSLPASF